MMNCASHHVASYSYTHWCAWKARVACMHLCFPGMNEAYRLHLNQWFTPTRLMATYAMHTCVYNVFTRVMGGSILCTWGSQRIHAKCALFSRTQLIYKVCHVHRRVHVGLPKPHGYIALHISAELKNTLNAK